MTGINSINYRIALEVTNISTLVTSTLSLNSRAGKSHPVIVRPPKVTYAVDNFLPVANASFQVDNTFGAFSGGSTFARILESYRLNEVRIYRDDGLNETLFFDGFVKNIRSSQDVYTIDCILSRNELQRDIDVRIPKDIESSVSAINNPINVPILAQSAIGCEPIQRKCQLLVETLPAPDGRDQATFLHSHEPSTFRTEIVDVRIEDRANEQRLPALPLSQSPTATVTPTTAGLAATKAFNTKNVEEMLVALNDGDSSEYTQLSDNIAIDGIYVWFQGINDATYDGNTEITIDLYRTKNNGYRRRNSIASSVINVLNDGYRADFRGTSDFVIFFPFDRLVVTDFSRWFYYFAIGISDEGENTFEVWANDNINSTLIRFRQEELTPGTGERERRKRVRRTEDTIYFQPRLFEYTTGKFTYNGLEYQGLRGYKTTDSDIEFEQVKVYLATEGQIADDTSTQAALEYLINGSSGTVLDTGIYSGTHVKIDDSEVAPFENTRYINYAIPGKTQALNHIKEICEEQGIAIVPRDLRTPDTAKYAIYAYGVEFNTIGPEYLLQWPIIRLVNDSLRPPEETIRKIELTAGERIYDDNGDIIQSGDDSYQRREVFDETNSTEVQDQVDGWQEFSYVGVDNRTQLKTATSLNSFIFYAKMQLGQRGNPPRYITVEGDWTDLLPISLMSYILFYLPENESICNGLNIPPITYEGVATEQEWSHIPWSGGELEAQIIGKEYTVNGTIQLKLRVLTNKNGEV